MKFLTLRREQSFLSSEGQPPELSAVEILLLWGTCRTHEGCCLEERHLLDCSGLRGAVAKYFLQSFLDCSGLWGMVAKYFLQSLLDCSGLRGTVAKHFLQSLLDCSGFRGKVAKYFLQSFLDCSGFRGKVAKYFLQSLTAIPNFFLGIVARRKTMIGSCKISGGWSEKRRLWFSYHSGRRCLPFQMVPPSLSFIETARFSLSRTCAENLTLLVSLTW